MRLAAVLLALVSGVPGARAIQRTETRAPCAASVPLRQPFFGDTHVHTVLSFDAWGQGTRNTPADAYRFARGEAVGVQPYDTADRPLRTVRLRRPLDFAIVTDHAELLGETRLCGTGGGGWICTIARRWPALGYMIVNSQVLDVEDPERYAFCGPGGTRCLEAAATPWAEIQRAAEEAYDRTAACRFTTFVGYEWSGAPGGYMIHRNVVFRNAVVPAQPANYIDDKTPQRLWQRLRTDCLDRHDGCDVLAIPHNPNLSGGLLFRVEDDDGTPMSRAEATTRAQLEVLLEVTQHKGDSECRPGGPTADELCGFEKLPFARMRESAMWWAAKPPPRLSYGREVLVEGLVQEGRLGVNPFKLGLIGSTDTHLGTPGLVDEDQFVGHAAGRATSRLDVPPLADDVRMNPGGLAVVWAEENSRDALFEAMRRREVYGTSGPRIVVRFFGGWDFDAAACAAPDLVAQGYARGVPMGGDLPPRPGDAAPVFMVSALQDAGAPDLPGMPLERLQIVKLWTDGDTPRERVFDVAVDPASGAGADPATCRLRGAGAAVLCGVWRDPTFAPGQRALYYARVVEHPSCRWTQWTCVRRGVDCARPDTVPDALAACCDPAVPPTIRERAWTSPIWYAPAGS